MAVKYQSDRPKFQVLEGGLSCDGKNLNYKFKLSDEYKPQASSGKACQTISCYRTPDYLRNKEIIELYNHSDLSDKTVVETSIAFVFGLMKYRRYITDDNKANIKKVERIANLCLFDEKGNKSDRHLDLKYEKSLYTKETDCPRNRIEADKLVLEKLGMLHTLFDVDGHGEWRLVAHCVYIYSYVRYCEYELNLSPYRPKDMFRRLNY